MNSRIKSTTKKKFLQACRVGDLDLIKSTLNVKEMANLKDDLGRPALYLAMGNLEVMEYLLFKGAADPDALIMNGRFSDAYQDRYFSPILPCLIKECAL